jgi:hypothetical protein
VVAGAAELLAVMRLIPPSIDPRTPSAGERDVFARFAAAGEAAAASARTGRATGRAAAGAGWTVLHSQDLAHHRRHLQGEIDFLVVAPGLGVLVLEVKGCHSLRRSDGLWFYGADHEGDRRGPFRQASEAMHSVRERLAGHRPHLSGVPFVSAVCFPFLHFTVTSEEWQPWQVIDLGKLDQRDIAGCVAVVLEQARAHAAAKHAGWFDDDAGEPTPGQCAEIVDFLRPDYEFFESPKERARRIDDEVRHFTEAQFAALDEMHRNRRVVFDGPAGTGKTLLALEAARRGHAAGRRVLLVCFNRPLATWLGEKAAGVADTMTVHDHMRRAAGIREGAPELRTDNARFWEVELPQRAWDALVEHPREYDELVVDEAQDVFRGAFRDVLDVSVEGGLKGGRWRVFGDFSHQAIYGDGVDLDAFCEEEGGGCAVFELHENCRNAPAVAALACAGAGLRAYGRVMRAEEGDVPAVRFYGDAAQQRQLLCVALEEFAAAGLTGPQVAVLSMHSDLHCVAATLTDPPWSDRLAPLMRDGPLGPVADLHSGKTCYASVHRYKGLEARAVVLTDVESLDGSRDRDLFYIGATRALQRLVVLARQVLRDRLTVIPGPSAG